MATEHPNLSGDDSAETVVDHAAAPAEKPMSSPSASTPVNTPVSGFGRSGQATAPPEIAARYEVIEQLGAGGMGVVFKARDRESGEVVALKVLRPEIASDSIALERFRGELTMARRITHKHVCRVYDINRYGGVAAISMEFVDGRSLRDLLEQVEGVSVHFGLRLTAQVLTALEEAHAAGVVHRDLKPENIMITRAGEAKLMDFGIARSIAAEGGGGIAGTPRYMSPEQAEGRPLDGRSDIYSLGLVLYELFTGRSAFEPSNAREMLRKQVQERAAPPSRHEPSLPQWLDLAIMRCLEKDPALRFQSAAQMRAALRPAQLSLNVPEEEIEPAARINQWTLADWLLCAFGLLGLVVFLALFERLMPAMRLRLQVDAITAKRVARELGQRLGRPFPDATEAHLESLAANYRQGIEDTIFGRSEQATDLVIWRVSFKKPEDPMLQVLSAAPELYVIVDSRGNPRLFHFDEKSAVPGMYEPPPAVQRHAIARSAAEMVCGAISQDDLLTETSGGDRGAQYTARWRPRRVSSKLPGIEATLRRELVINVDCDQRVSFEPELPLASMFLPAEVARSLLRMVAAFAVTAFFFVSRMYLWPFIWKRAPLAFVAGLASAWVTWDDALRPLGLDPRSLASYGVLLLSVFLWIPALWVSIAVAEQLAGRWMRSRLASYVRLWSGRMRDREVVYAILRGTAIGLLFVGGQALLTVAVRAANSRLWEAKPFLSAFAPLSRVLFALLLFVPSALDVEGVASALTSPSPELFVLASTFGVMVVIGLATVGIGWSTWERKRLTTTKRFHPSVELWTVALWVSLLGGDLLHSAGYLPGPMATVSGPMVVAGVLCLALRKYDLLTSMIAIGTLALWNLNYPLLILRSEVGNGTHWLIFAAWGGVILTAAIAAWRAKIEVTL